MKQISCVECGKTVTYRTNKPKRCRSCKEQREARFTYKKRKPSRSKKEGLMQKVLNELLPDAEFIDNGYYSWLESPRGSQLQLDRYYPGLKLAFEFNGRQHYEFNRYMHKDQKAFEYLQECDDKKRRDCKKHGVTLISIKYNKTITKEYMLKRFKQAGVISDIRRETRIAE
jgi:hypothetical protein